jgi:spore germination protein GerM
MKIFHFTNAFFLVLLAFTATWPFAASQTPENNAAFNEKQTPATSIHLKSTANLYFIHPDNNWLTSEKRVLAHEDNVITLAKLIVEGLIEGPRNDLSRSLPKDTELRSLFTDQQKTAYVDLKMNKEHFPGGCVTEYMMIFSLVNSLALNLPEIEQVKILINGDDVHTVAGHIDARNPFKANMLIVR